MKILTLSRNAASYREGEVYAIGSQDVGKIYPGARAAFFGGRRYVKELITWKPDIVHSQSEFTSFSYAKKIAKASGAALLHTYHTIYEDYTHYFSTNEALGKKAAALFTRKRLKHCDGVIVPTVKVENILKGYGVKQPIFCLPTGIVIEHFQEARRERLLYGSRTSLEPVLVTVGRIAREKNLDEILHMLRSEQGKRYHWLIVGDGPYRRELEAKVRSYGLSGRVTFTGMIPRGEVAKYYQLGDVFVSASCSETQGLTYVEALASGLPVVARKDDCLNGVVLNGYNGWQYENTQEFFQALQELFPENLPDYGRVTGWQYEMCSVNAANSAWKYSKGAFGFGAEKIYRKFLWQQEEMEWRLQWNIRKKQDFI